MDKRSSLTAVLIFLVTFLLYGLTVSPDITFEDSPELVTAVHTLGIPHPPGYPFFILASKLFSFLPLGPIEKRINLSSSFFTALAMVFLFLAFLNVSERLKLKNNLTFSAFIVLLLSISSTLWSNALVTEVYASYLMLFSIQLFLLTRLLIKTDLKYIYLFIFISGLALGSHYTSVFMGFAFILFFLKKKWFRSLTLKHYLSFIALFFLGASIYLYLPLRAMQHPVLNWANPSNFKNFISVISRQQYGPFPEKWLSLKNIINSFQTINPLYEFYQGSGENLLPQFILILPLGLILYLVYRGVWRTRGQRDILYLFSFVFFSYTFLLILMTQTPPGKLFTLKVFFIPAWISLYFFSGLGLFHLFRSKTLILILCPVLFFFNLPFHSHGNYHYTGDYADNLFKNLSYGSVIFTVKDNETFPLWELSCIKYKRPDVSIVNVVILSEPWYLEGLQRHDRNLRIGLPYLKGRFAKKQIRRTLINDIIKNNPDRPLYITSLAFKEYVDIDQNAYSCGVLYSLDEKKENNTGYLYYLNFKNLEINYNIFLIAFERLALENFRFPHYLDAQSKLALSSLSRLLHEYGESLYAYKLSVYFNKVIGLGINNVYAFTRIGDLFLQKKDIRRFIYFYKKAILLQPRSSYARELQSKIEKVTRQPVNRWLEQAEEHYRRKNYPRALALYMNILQHYQDSKIYSGIGDCYFQMENIPQAIQFYKKAIEFDKQYITPYYNLGGCYVMTGDRAKAIQIWKKGLTVSAENTLLKDALKKWGK